MGFSTVEQKTRLKHFEIRTQLHVCRFVLRDIARERGDVNFRLALFAREDQRVAKAYSHFHRFRRIAAGLALHDGECPLIDQPRYPILPSIELFFCHGDERFGI